MVQVLQDRSGKPVGVQVVSPAMGDHLPQRVADSGKRNDTLIVDLLVALSEQLHHDGKVEVVELMEMRCRVGDGNGDPFAYLLHADVDSNLFQSCLERIGDQGIAVTQRPVEIPGDIGNHAHYLRKEAKKRKAPSARKKSTAPRIGKHAGIGTLR